jgi:ribonuclease VapC
MIVDTSAAVAIILREPHFEELADRLLDEVEVGMGTPSLAECGIVLASRPHPDWRTLIDEFKARFELEDIPFSSDHWVIAVEAYEKFGKGRHPARLNFGDCLSYAVARVENRPLLFVGNDFPLTDLWKA